MDITDVLENQSFVHVGVDLAKNVFQVAYKNCVLTPWSTSR